MHEEDNQSDCAIITKQKSTPFVLGVTFQTSFVNTGKAVFIALFIFADDL